MPSALSSALVNAQELGDLSETEEGILRDAAATAYAGTFFPSEREVVEY